jgi:parallel beta-helix repeat protein
MDKRCAILLVSVTILVLCFLGTASATNWSVDGSGGADFTGIQDAINNAKDGDRILVYFGVYHENVVVDKSVTLKGIGHTVVDANGSDSAITLTADGTTLVGFSVTNSGSSWSDVGIKVTSNNNTITGNNVCNNDGIGIYLPSSSNNNTITGNNVCNNKYGIFLYHSSNNTITGNVFVNDDLFVYSSYQNIVEDNTVNGKPLVYLEDVSDYKVEDAGQVILVNCDIITVENLDLSNTSGGIALWKTENSKISNNTVCNNRKGISLDDSSNNTITGNNVSNNSGSGIHLYHSSNNTITDNNVSSNNRGGIRLYHSSNNTITGNNVSSNNRSGIRLSPSSNNTITGNNVSNNNDYGISLSSSSNNTITGNNVSNNNYGGICLRVFNNNNTITNNVFNDGLSVYFSYQNTVEDNTVNGKPLVYLEDVSDYKVEDAGQVIIVNCNNITIENLDLSNTSGGIALWKTENSKTENSKISNNTVCNNRGGICLSYSRKNTITGNNVCSNNWDGIRLYDSSNNKIYFNNFINNTDNVDSYISTNIWNSPLEITYTYDGTTYKSYLGNYWDDYEGITKEWMQTEMELEIHITA